MEPLTFEKIIEIHDDVIATFGGTRGVLERGTIEFLVYQANREEDIFRKAAIVLYFVCSKHPFIDGNKRTAFITAENILGQSDYYIDSDGEKVVEFMLEVAKYQHNIKSMKKWLEENARKEL